LEITIQRIERVNPKLNSVTHNLHDQALQSARYWISLIRAGQAASSHG
jgi:hypothetical protein